MAASTATLAQDDSFSHFLAFFRKILILPYQCSATFYLLLKDSGEPFFERSGKAFGERSDLFQPSDWLKRRRSKVETHSTFERNIACKQMKIFARGIFRLVEFRLKFDFRVQIFANGYKNFNYEKLPFDVIWD